MPSLISSISNALPWLAQYPVARARAIIEYDASSPKHLIICIANHFEPSWKGTEIFDLETQKRRLDDWCKLAERAGESVKDSDGTKFRHTNFYPAEQYDRGLLNTISDLQSAGLGEVEIHLHHGVESPDTEEGLRCQLIEFRDRLANDHKCLSLMNGQGTPMYAFVHGNWALGNSANGRYCGVDNEFEILRETGCYIDMTLPSAPDISQVPVLNSVYECGLPFSESAPHRKEKRLKVDGSEPQLPVLITGPLMLDWSARQKALPLPKFDNAELAHFRKTDLRRLDRWVSANITVKGRPDWCFIKLHCHGFFDEDQSACIGEEAIRTFSEIVEHGEITGAYKVHFATAREVFNILLAAVEGRNGSPNDYRDHRLLPLMYGG